MTCDGTSTDTLTANDVWQWVYVDPVLSDGTSAATVVADWSNPVIDVRDSAGVLLASNESTGDEVAVVHTDGGFDGEIPATDFEADPPVFAWWVDSAERESWPEVVGVEAEVLVNGVPVTVYPSRSYRVKPDRAVREEGS